MIPPIRKAFRSRPGADTVRLTKTVLQHQGLRQQVSGDSVQRSTLMLQNKPGAISAGRPARSNIHVNDFLRIHHFRRGPAA